MRRWILDEKHQLVETDLMTWASFFEDIKKRRVASTKRGRINVSTVFLGIDHNFGDAGDPVLFETMVFGGLQSGFQTRYHTWDEAVKGHSQTTRMMLGGWYGILNLADAEVVYWWKETLLWLRRRSKNESC